MRKTLLRSVGHFLPLFFVMCFWALRKSAYSVDIEMQKRILTAEKHRHTKIGHGKTITHFYHIHVLIITEKAEERNCLSLFCLHLKYSNMLPNVYSIDVDGYTRYLFA